MNANEIRLIIDRMRISERTYDLTSRGFRMTVFLFAAAALFGCNKSIYSKLFEPLETPIPEDTSFRALLVPRQRPDRLYTPVRHQL